MATSSDQDGDNPVSDQIDSKIIEYFKRLEELANTKQEFERVIHEGYINLSQARYVLGQTAISPLSYNNVMIPTAFMHPEQGDDSISFDLEFISLNPSKSKQNNIEKTELIHEGELSKRIKQSLDKDTEPKQDQLTTKKLSGADPLRWFSALPPHSLRSAQSNFQRALSIISNLATLQCSVEASRTQLYMLLK